MSKKQPTPEVSQLEPTLTTEEIIQIRHIQRVLEQVEDAGSIVRAARGLRMSEEDVERIVESQKQQ